LHRSEPLQRLEAVQGEDRDAVEAGRQETVSGLIDALEQLHSEMRREHLARADDLARVHPIHRHGAANLIDYLVLRRHDVRSLQLALAELGLSSLGRAEEHVITTLERVLDNLYLMAGRQDRRRTEAAVGFGAGRGALEDHANALLGPTRFGALTRILVTMPSEAASDEDLVRALMKGGMGCARINCAHDGPRAWKKIVDNLRRAAKELGVTCPILMDLPGPKLRTGPITPGPRVLHLHPRRDDLGRPIEPARVRVVAADARATGESKATGPAIPVDPAWLRHVHCGDIVRLRDTRGNRRNLVVTEASGNSLVAEVWNTTYLVTGTDLVTDGGWATSVGPLPALEQSIHLRVDDVLTLTSSATPVPPSLGDTTQGRLEGRDPRTAVRIGCTLPAALDALGVGHRVLFDDGTIAGIVTAVRKGEVDIRITSARPDGSKLRAEKGINVPDSKLNLPALSPDDEALLPFIADHADLVGLSFTQQVGDVRHLQDRLGRLGNPLGIVLKIETARGFASLPELLLTGMESERVGVMVARGDLAVECGFERLAELQEEILCLCDAAHLPVIWATQVLDQMAHLGRPSRAEVSDAVMGGRTECVMLNKGPHIVETVLALNDILYRMSAHQQKKVSLLRRLRSWSTEGKIAPEDLPDGYS
jgi:pyruvate kinase